MADIIGKTVAGYPIEKLLAKVSFGEVYQAATSADPLAVRLLREDVRDDAGLNAAVVKGWEAARTVTHANLVTGFGAGVEPGLGAYCLEELIRGRPLRQIILDGSKMAWRDCLIVAEQLFTALNLLHGARIIHGDIWAASVLITQDQDLKLEGAGGLLFLDRRPTDLVHGPALGYMAPEVLKGSPICAGSDIYSAGACLYFILAGHDPYPPEQAETLAQTVASKKLARVTALRDDLPPEADEFIARLMAHDPTQRYGSAAGVLSDIGRLKEGGPLGPLHGGVAAKSPQFPSKSKSSAAVPVVGSGGSGAAPGLRRSGIGMTVGGGRAGNTGQQKRVSGFPAAVSSSNMAASGTRVFGRLDTHVKSTIPQSDTEQRGDDLYRQGQLPLALACWREAYENSPHTGLKVKLEVGERDLKKEAYTIAMEEARHRLHVGDFAGAIGRTQEALVSAENEQQRNDALSVKREADVGLEKDLKASKIKMIVGSVVLLVLLVVGFFWISSNRAKPGNEENNPIAVPNMSSGLKNAEPVSFSLPAVNAAIPRYPAWKAYGSDGLAIYQSGSGDPAVTFIAVKSDETQSEAFNNIQTRMSNHEQYKNAKTIAISEHAFSVDGTHPVSKLNYRYTRKDTNSGIVYFFLIDGPNHSLYLATFDGREDLFTPELQDEAVKMMQGWRFNKS